MNITKAIILNDTSRNVGHIGCETVMSNIHYLCRKYHIETIASYENTASYLESDYKYNLQQADIVIVNGEGTLHHDQKSALEIMESVQLAHKMGKRCYLINSVWQDNNVLNNMLFMFEKVFVRESLSKSQIISYSNKIDVQIVPDISLYKIKDREENFASIKKSGVTFIDSVNWSVTKELARQTHSLTVKRFYLMDGDFYKKMRSLRLFYILFMQKKQTYPRILRHANILESSAIVSGRFHGLCLALKYGIPCLSVESNTHKQKGMIIDIGLPVNKYLVDLCEISEHSFGDKIKNFIQADKEREAIKKYIEVANSKIEKMFSLLK